MSVLFADIVGFTPLAEDLGAQALVELLNEVFVAFDDLAEAAGMEKIKTIGDAYMVVGGLPDAPRRSPELPCSSWLSAMCDAISEVRTPHGEPLQLRIGIDVGPVVAGVIGRRKFSYDVWGDTVNTASRMESHGVPGRIQVTERVARAASTTVRLRTARISRSQGQGIDDDVSPRRCKALAQLPCEILWHCEPRRSFDQGAATQPTNSSLMCQLGAIGPAYWTGGSSPFRRQVQRHRSQSDAPKSARADCGRGLAHGLPARQPCRLGVAPRPPTP